MICCDGCKYWQHGVCFLILDEDEAPNQHVCDLCAEVIKYPVSVIMLCIGSYTSGHLISTFMKQV